MVYISLPNFIVNNAFNNLFNLYVKNNPDKLIFPFQIESYYGSFPYSVWNGDINSNYGEAMLYPAMSQFVLTTQAPLRLDLSNTLLNNTDLYNIHENTILKLCESNGTMVELSDLSLLAYIENNYYNYSFILSPNAALIHEFNEDIINSFCEQDNFILISLLKNIPIDFNKINKKHKIEIIVGNNKCNKCNYFEQMKCRFDEQQLQTMFSGNSVYNYCNKINGIYMDDSYIKNEILELKNQGFTHFKIANPCYNNFKIFNRTLIQNLIKPEYINDCFNYITGNLL